MEGCEASQTYEMEQTAANSVEKCIKRKGSPNTMNDGKRVMFQEESNEVGSTEDFKFSDHPSLEKIRRLQSQFVHERNWDQYHSPRNILLAMVGEVGEVAELFQWRGEVKEGIPDWSKAEKEHLGEELSDVLVYLIRLAEKCHVDLPQAVLQKMDKNRRKYPADKVYGSSKKYTEYKNECNSDK